MKPKTATAGTSSCNWFPEQASPSRIRLRVKPLGMIQFSLKCAFLRVSRRLTFSRPRPRIGADDSLLLVKSGVTTSPQSSRFFGLMDDLAQSKKWSENKKELKAQ
jgi:hypothetical protein